MCTARERERTPPTSFIESTFASIHANFTRAAQCRMRIAQFTVVAVVVAAVASVSVVAAARFSALFSCSECKEHKAACS